MMALTREQIDQLDDRPVRLLNVPDWGEVYIRKMGGSERDSYDLARVVMGADGKILRPNLENLRAKLAVRVLCDETGKRLYADNEVSALASKSHIALDFIFDEANKMNGLDDESIEAIEGNSESAPSGSSGSD